MINRLKHYITRYKWKKLKWKKVGTFNVDFGFIVINPECIEIGDCFSSEYNLRLQAWKKYLHQNFNPYIKIGNHVSMMENCQISCCSNITIGDGCLFGANVFITDNFHGNNTLEQVNMPPLDRHLEVKGEVHIGDNVWIGRNVCIMPGVTIGDGAVIGSNAVVTHDIPEKSVAVGIPAKVIKQIR